MADQKRISCVGKVSFSADFLMRSWRLWCSGSFLRKDFRLTIGYQKRESGGGKVV